MESIEVVVVDSLWTIVQAIGTCIGAIGAVVALLYFAKQTKSMAESYQFDYQWRKKNKSSELALFYSQSLLPRISYCSAVIEKAEIYPRLKAINKSEMKRFTRKECNDLFGSKEDIFQAVKKSIAQIDITVFFEKRLIVPKAFRHDAAEHAFSQAERKGDLGQQASLHAIAEKEFQTITSGLLNDIEYFSMCIQTGIADGKILYPSLHQTFFKTIHAFYFFISYHNVSMSDKYFTHTIDLFHAWEACYRKHERAESRAEEAINHSFEQIA